MMLHRLIGTWQELVFVLLDICEVERGVKCKSLDLFIFWWLHDSLWGLSFQDYVLTFLINMSCLNDQLDTLFIVLKYWFLVSFEILAGILWMSGKRFITMHGHAERSSNKSTNQSVHQSVNQSIVQWMN